VRERGSWKVVAGTGAYADAEGSGTYVARAEMAGSCDENTPPTSFFAVIEADGRISL
jgi:hypothetical protein